MFLHLVGLLFFSLDIIQHFIRFSLSLLANAQKNLAAYNLFDHLYNLRCFSKKYAFDQRKIHDMPLRGIEIDKHVTHGKRKKSLLNINNGIQ